MPQPVTRKRTRRPTLREIGEQLANELGAIIDEAEPDDPKARHQVLAYIKSLDQRHPEWRPIMEQSRIRHLRRLDARQSRTVSEF